MKKCLSENIGKIGLVTAAAAVPLFLLAPGRATKRQKAPFMGRNFAHRGLHSRDMSATCAIVAQSPAQLAMYS